MPKSILIIEDEEDASLYIETILRKAGYDTGVAVNGEEALHTIEQAMPDLITLDILMPLKSGLSFFETLRRQPGTKEIPVIVISGISGNNEFFEQNRLGGLTRFMDKPIKPEDLVKNVKELIGE